MTPFNPQPTQSRLRVLHISGRSDHGGGPEHIFQVITANMSNIEHYIACPNQGIYWERYRYHLGAGRLFDIPHRKISFNAIRRLWTFIQKEKIQLLHSHGTCGGIYSRLLGHHLRIPVVHSFHGMPVTMNIQKRIHNLAENVLAYFTDRAIAVSNGEAFLAHQRWPHYHGKLIAIPNGITNHVTPVWTSWQMEGTLRIVSFSRDNHQKNPELLIEIARILHLQGVDFRIDAYGEGLVSSHLQTTAIRRGIGDRLFFHSPTNSPIQTLTGACIYLSTSRWEGMPLAVLEAWHAGLIVVASDVVGNNDLVTDGTTGCLFPSDNGRAAARIIRDLKSNMPKAEMIRQSASEHGIKNHSNSLMARRIEHLYSQIASG